MHRLLVIGSIVLGLAAACAAAGDGDNARTPDSAESSAGAGAGGAGVDPCGLCAMPPEPSCSSPCTSTTYDANGTCEDTTCVYPSHVEDCKFGCDAPSGVCRTPDAAGDACADVMCGEKNACGGTCDNTSGCCFLE